MAKMSKVKAAEQPALVPITEPNFNLSTQAGLEAWIYWHYRHRAFRSDGTFKGLPWLRKHLFSLGTALSKTKIRQSLHP
jgi:hypothetical protein